MNYPKAIEDLIKAQNNFDSAAYAACFNESGMMLEEGKWYQGRTEIRQMIEHANEKYRSVMKPVSLTGPEASPVLSAEVSGTFPGSPAILKFHFELDGGLIQSLKVTG
jgi:hypothetical protein